MSQTNTIPTATSSEGDNMFDIQTLTSQVQQLENSYGRWNKITLWLVAGTAIVAALYFVVSWIASIKGESLQKAQSALIRAKDEQLTRDLKDKDDQIAVANRKAAEANAEAAKANEGLGKSNEKIASLTAEAERAKADRAEALKQIASLNAEAEKAREGIATARAEAAKATQRAEEEHRARTELEGTIAPRIFGMTSEDKSLMAFAGTKVIIVALADMEAWRTAQQIAFVLGQSGWKIIGITRTLNDSGFMDGVIIETKMKQPPEFRGATFPAGEALLNQLRNYKIEARHFQSMKLWPKEIPDDAVLVRIGFKPQTYFLEKMLDEPTRKMLEDMRRKEEEMRRRAEEIWRKYGENKP